MVAGDPGYDRESRAQLSQRPLDVRRLFRHVPGDQQPIVRECWEAGDEFAVRRKGDVEVADGKKPGWRACVQLAPLLRVRIMSNSGAKRSGRTQFGDQLGCFVGAGGALGKGRDGSSQAGANR